MNSNLGFGWRSITGLAKRAAKRAYKVASIPTRVASRIANVTASSLCRNGAATTSDAPSRAFCRAMKAKDEFSARKYLPAAVQTAANRAKAAQQLYVQAAAVAQQPLKGADPDTNLLASLSGAGTEELSFALAGVDPGEIGAVATSSELLALAPLALVVAAGVFMLTRK